MRWLFDLGRSGNNMARNQRDEGAMQSSFSLAVDVEHSFIRVTLAGFFTPTDIARFDAARAEAHQRLKCRQGDHVTLVDMREMKIQSQESVGAFQALIANPRYHGRRIAIVVASSLARSQIKRAATGRGAAYFHSIESAEAWLQESDCKAAA
ncbi:hypothetical protein Q5H91_07705 [Sphingomonas sp. KR1UV-12]|uniref:STAS/SEC14 domain-containing protein n=1 Tax=Sphingomonas aurea TaxID=3063994 RepID=A0ABT9EJF0_9SPHN|nr:hypothetical protein [Sphingomonas sp. KR1UV-12]MDP1027093.1 hypothetical protein [Sphingomonas sp. KR1UV-12]